VSYDIGRLADPILSMLALSHAERNLLSPEINARNLLPSGTIPESYNGVTIARLMNHTAGMGTEELAPLEALPFAELPGIALTSFPGERFSYCTRCYGLLVTTLEAIGGLSIDAQLEQTVFYPLMMDATRVDEGHIISTAQDMAKIMSLHVQDGRWQGVQLVKPETIRALHRASISTGRDSREFAGYGWFVLTDAGIDTPDPNLNHVVTAYDIGGYRAQMTLIPALGRGVLLMTDQDTQGLNELAALTLEAFTGWAAPLPQSTRNTSLLVGNFRPRDSAASEWLSVSEDDEALQISLGDATTRATFVDSRAVAFQINGHQASLFFPEMGLAREAILTMDGVTAVYQRVFD
jgi:CubicO group peptidase (beta-lactamase class C family)